MFSRIELKISLLFAILIGFSSLASKEVVSAENGQQDNPVLAVELDFNAIQAGWWTGFDNLGGPEKLNLIQKFSSQVKAQTDRLPDGMSQNENVRVLPSILQQLDSSISYDKGKEDTPKLSENYSYKEWLLLFGKTKTIDKQITLLQHDRTKLINSLGLLKQDLASLFVAYRPMDSQSPERLLQGAKILRQQFTYLLYQANSNRIKQRIQEKSDSHAAYLQSLQAAKSRLSFTEKSLNEIEESIRNSEKPQGSLITEIEQLEISQIGKSTTNNREIITLLERNTLLRSFQVQQLKFELLKAYGELLNGELKERTNGWKNRLSQQKTFYETHRQEFRAIFNASSETVPAEISQSPNQQGDPKNQKYWTLVQLVQSHINSIEDILVEIEFILATYQEQLNASATGWDWVKSFFGTSYQGGLDATLSVIQFPLFTVNETPVTLIDITRVTLILIVAVIISRMVRKGLAHMGQNFRGFSEASLFAISKIVHYLILIVALIMGLSSIGLDFTNLALVAGALSVGIGFGLQSIFNNFISGLILLIERPLKVGDVVELESGVRGRIKAINVRSTQLTTRDNIDILVPNSEFISGRVTNYTLDDSTRRLRIPFGVAYGSDKELVKKAAIEAAEAIPYTVMNNDKEIEISMVAFGASSLDFELIVWIDNNNMPPKHSIVSMYLWEIESKFNEYQIEIPFPQQDIHVRSVAAEYITVKT